MVTMNWRRLLAPVSLSLFLLMSGCGTAEAPSSYEQTQEETSGKDASAVAGDAIQGSEFNQFFPDDADGFQVVPSQEKRGFAEYKLNQGNTTIAMLSVNDTISNPEAAQKFANSKEEIAGYPALDIGKNQTAVLIADRFQVKVQSRDDSFAKSDREAWLQRFDLDGISQLQ